MENFVITLRDIAMGEPPTPHAGSAASPACELSCSARGATQWIGRASIVQREETHDDSRTISITLCGK